MFHHLRMCSSNTLLTEVQTHKIHIYYIYLWFTQNQIFFLIQGAWSEKVWLIAIKPKRNVKTTFWKEKKNPDCQISVISAEKTLNTENRNSRENKKNECQIINVLIPSPMHCRYLYGSERSMKCLLFQSQPGIVINKTKTHWA